MRPQDWRENIDRYNIQYIIQYISDHKHLQLPLGQRALTNIDGARGFSYMSLIKSEGQCIKTLNPAYIESRRCKGVATGISKLPYIGFHMRVKHWKILQWKVGPETCGDVIVWIVEGVEAIPTHVTRQESVENWWRYDEFSCIWYIQHWMSHVGCACV
jgi:hypothetical protein